MMKLNYTAILGRSGMIQEDCRGVTDSCFPNTMAASSLAVLFCSLQQSKDLSMKQEILVLANETVE